MKELEVTIPVDELFQLGGDDYEREGCKLCGDVVQSSARIEHLVNVHSAIHDTDESDRDTFFDEVTH